MMDKNLSPIHPGEVLLEDFMKRDFDLPASHKPMHDLLGTLAGIGA